MICEYEKRLDVGFDSSRVQRQIPAEGDGKRFARAAGQAPSQSAPQFQAHPNVMHGGRNRRTNRFPNRLQPSLRSKPRNPKLLPLLTHV